MAISLSDLLPALSTKQVALLLVEATAAQDPDRIALLVGQMQDSGGAPMGAVKAAFMEAAAAERWDLCMQIKPLIPQGHEADVHARCWNMVAERGLMSILDHLPALGMHEGDLNMAPLLARRNPALFGYFLRERPDQLPDLRRSNRDVAGALHNAAAAGPKACQAYLDLIQSHLPAQQAKLPGVVHLAWEGVVMHDDTSSAYTLATLGLWPERLDLDGLFHAHVGAALCHDPDWRSRIAQAWMRRSAEEMEDVETQFLDTLLGAGVAVLEWKGEDQTNLAHHLLRGKSEDPMNEALAWILHRNPRLLVEKDNRQRTPLETVYRAEVPGLQALGERVHAMGQADELDGHAAAAPGLTRGRRL